MSRFAVGDPLSGPTYRITQEKIDAYSRYALEGRDTRNIHTDGEKARLAGLPGPVAHGRYPTAFLSEAMVRAFGEVWFRSGHLEVTLTRLIFPGDRLTVRGEVAAITPENGGQRVEVTLALVNQNDEIVQSGRASAVVVERTGAP